MLEGEHSIQRNDSLRDGMPAAQQEVQRCALQFLGSEPESIQVRQFMPIPEKSQAKREYSKDQRKPGT